MIQGACAAFAAVWFLTVPAPVRGAMMLYDQARAAFEAGDYAQADKLLAEELRENPGNEEAYRIWAETLEKLGDLQGSADAWETLKLVTANEELQNAARRQMLRLERILLADRREEPKFENPFDMGDLGIDYTDLEEVDSTDYRGIYPPFTYESRNFTIYACNEKLAKITAELSEKCLRFLLDRMLEGRAWAVRVPIFVYADHDDYVKVGGNSPWSGGVTVPDYIGRVAKVAIFQLYDEKTVEEHGFKNRVSQNLEDTLLHELTHVVINEFFGAQETPRWMHEAFAQQMEQNRKQYEEAAKLAQDAVAGEYFRFRDLFSARQYPATSSKSRRFYEQSATIATFLAERGPEATLAFLNELAHQKGHDAAIAAAWGIPEEGAVEALEKMWVEWMTQRYVKDLKRDDREEPTVARESDSRLFRSPFDELASVNAIEQWRAVKPEGPGECRGIGTSLRDWTLGPEVITSKLPDEQSQSMLAVRMYEELPIAVKCRVRWTGREDENLGWFGFAVLDAQMEDMGVQALARLDDNRVHDLTCVIGDEIAVYLDDRCAGRYPVPPWPDDVQVDYPVALVTYSPVEVTDFQVGTIDAFKDLAADEEEDQGKKGRRGRGAGRGKRGGEKGKDAGEGKKPPKEDDTDKGKKKKPKKKKKKRPKKRPGRVGPDIS